MKDALRVLAYLTLLIALYGCIYTIERRWAYSPQSSLNQSTAPMGQQDKATKEAESRFEQTLRGCIAREDPNSLGRYDEAHEYRLSGWFVNEQRTVPVVRCMNSHDWILYPTKIYAP
jgi:hypothetical protein